MNAPHPSYPGWLAPYVGLLRFGFRLLYNQLAWAYDRVATVTSLGQWWDWQRQALPFLPEAGQVLEIGHGTGHMLLELLDRGCRPVGLDLSPAMARLAQRRLRRHGQRVPLVRGRVQALPFATGSIPVLLSTFPTEFIVDPAALGEMRRVLRRADARSGQPPGTLVVVPSAILRPISRLQRFMRWLFLVTGQSGPRDPNRPDTQLDWPPQLEETLAHAGLAARVETIGLSRSVVFVVVATPR